ncbi:kelch repeat and BTB domain-containing protein 12-like [Platichthys flesus]|uniref:kelch repeat and BTB domain-containing protein 12-like n=1 Tax=Platichthys flesus TaxID=8260 RepID=UPI002DB6FEBF|nr:kelch repeat and BTB domain-containing protein 12-like [Platichthys flesus]
MRTSEELTDVVLLAEGIPFACHKVVLSAFSPYFQVCEEDKVLDLDAQILGDLLRSDDLNISQEEMVLDLVLRWVERRRGDSQSEAQARRPSGGETQPQVSVRQQFHLVRLFVTAWRPLTCCSVWLGLIRMECPPDAEDFLTSVGALPPMLEKLATFPLH